MSLKDQGGCYECGVSTEDWELLHKGPMVLIGTAGVDGVVWSGPNPHCWPVGTKIYAQLPEKKDDASPSSTEA